jgi:hypothetical protein
MQRSLIIRGATVVLLAPLVSDLKKTIFNNQAEAATRRTPILASAFPRTP